MLTTEKYLRRNRCSICTRFSFNQKNINEKFCEKYLLEFLKELSEKFDKSNAIDDHFNSWIFADEDEINQTSCNGLTLMHVNILGGREEIIDNESDEQNTNTNNNNPYIVPYDELTALNICQILLKRGASPHGNYIYEMRPLHIAVRREWLDVTRVLLEAGANPNIPERDIYASRPMDIAVINDNPKLVEILYMYGASLNGIKTMFHLPPLAEAFVRGYFDVYKTLLELGARPILGLDRNFFRSVGIELFDTGIKGRQQFIQLLFDHGGNIETQFNIHAIRVESDGISNREPFLKFCCDVICIADVNPKIFIKWISECRSLKALCRLAFRRYCFNTFNDGFKRLSSFKSYNQLNQSLYNYLMFIE